MTSFMELSVSARGLLALWYMVLLLLACAAAFRLFTQKNFRMAVLSVAVMAISYVIVQWCSNVNMKHVDFESAHMPVLFEGVSWIWLFLIGLLLMALNVCFHLYAQHWYKTHVSATSLKEGMDDLPVGLCWYTEDGTPRSA